MGKSVTAPYPKLDKCTYPRSWASWSGLLFHGDEQCNSDTRRLV